MPHASEAASPAERSARVRDLPISISIASVVVLAMLVMATVLITIGWISTRERLLESASQAANDASVIIAERTGRMLEPAQASLRQISLHPVAQARTLRERYAHLQVLYEELRANPLVSAVYVGYDNGDFFLVRSLHRSDVRQQLRAPEGAVFLVQAVHQPTGGARTGEFRFLDGNGETLEIRSRPDYLFDPRERPWYVAANRSVFAEGAQVSSPYVFFTTQQIGITLSQTHHSGASVVGLDVVLDDLALSLRQLKLTPRTQLAVVNGQGQVVVHPELDRIVARSPDAEGFSYTFKSLAELGEPSLLALADRHRAGLTVVGGARQGVMMEVDGLQWKGSVLPFDLSVGDDYELYVTVPVDDLLQPARERRTAVIWLVLAVALTMLPLGWWAGSRVGRSLDRLTALAGRIGRFDFSRPHDKPTFVREVNQLSGVMGEMGHTIQSFLGLSQQMASERQVELMLERVLVQLLAATRCHGGAVYLWDHRSSRMELASSQGPMSGWFPPRFDYPPGRLPRQAARKLADAGLVQMEVDLRGRSGELQGLMVLVHPDDLGHRDPAFVQFAHQLSGMLAVSIETRQLIESQKKLLDAVIRLMADAIDAKSPYTGGHCERVPELATWLVDRLSTEQEGPYSAFAMTEEQRYEFHLGAWLHDCGKVTSPEHIVDKATKLEVIGNRIHEIRTRFEVLWRDAEIAHLKRVATGEDATASEAHWRETQQRLQEDFAFVAHCNVGSEFMADEAVRRLKAIARQTWQRHFDNRIGLAWDEAGRLAQAQPVPVPLPATEHLLADRPEHVVPWGGRKPPVERDDPANHHGFDMALPAARQNMGELYNLSIRRGTLTDEDRFRINDHIVQTYVMLKGLPWPAHLQRVPEIAATHHERLDGQGYPRKLPADRLTLADRVMALADVFEALTASDRPYKTAKTLNESLRIMAHMCHDRHLDSELFRYFLRSGLWLTYAQRYLQPGQIDAVDVVTIEKLLPAPTTAPVTAASPASAG